MEGIGDVNHIDTVHDDINPEYKKAMEKAMANEEIVAYDSATELNEIPTETTEKVEMTKVQEPMTEFRPLTEEEQAKQMPPTTLNQERPTNIWLQFNTVSVGWDEEGKPTATFDLVTLLRGLERLGSLEIRPMPQPEEYVPEMPIGEGDDAQA